MITPSETRVAKRPPAILSTPNEVEQNVADFKWKRPGDLQIDPTMTIPPSTGIDGGASLTLRLPPGD